VVTSLRILDFDIENRPLSYLGPEFSTAEITAIAACWDGHPKSMTCWLLGVDDPVDMLEGFRKAYDAADMVTGHYIRMHDLPIINGAMVELGLPCLGDKLTCDTKMDLVKKGSTISASQENLCQMLGLPQPKIHMNNALWREANRLTPAGLRATKRRAVGDVIQHMALRKALVERNLLSGPKVWRA
jgi:hypothetical protein